MKGINKVTIDGHDMVVWYTDTDFEYSAEAGDHVNVRFRNRDSMTYGRIGHVDKEFVVVEGDGDCKTLCFYKDIMDMEKVYYIETELVQYIPAVTHHAGNRTGANTDKPILFYETMKQEQKRKD